MRSSFTVLGREDPHWVYPAAKQVPVKHHGTHSSLEENPTFSWHRFDPSSDEASCDTTLDRDLNNYKDRPAIPWCNPSTLVPTRPNERKYPLHTVEASGRGDFEVLEEWDNGSLGTQECPYPPSHTADRKQEYASYLQSEDMRTFFAPQPGSRKFRHRSYRPIDSKGKSSFYDTEPSKNYSQLLVSELPLSNHEQEEYFPDASEYLTPETDFSIQRAPCTIMVCCYLCHFQRDH